MHCVCKERNISNYKKFQSICESINSDYGGIDVLVNAAGISLPKDENEFDDNAASNAMDYVFSQTKEEPLFQKIYQIAAAKMISTDLQTGLAICFSYDYLGVFHKCLYQYLQNPTEFTKESSCFQSMMKKIE